MHFQALPLALTGMLLSADITSATPFHHRLDPPDSRNDPSIDPGQWRELTGEECQTMHCYQLEYMFHIEFADHDAKDHYQVGTPYCQEFAHDTHVTSVKFSKGMAMKHYKLFKPSPTQGCLEEDVIFVGRQGLTEFPKDYVIGSYIVSS